ncbi:glycosyltransferase family A protein [Succinivibrio sp.]|uniref:glycosyltransferase family 2 protein n=1 Tax=Succinivibrio sp. TaxID=2053619 RepID=UPI002600E88B|nr:glycosyltransferase family A protein [Succinivibrio sp.]MBQ9221984.1 glycosyltransferase family 2 protein [Succinivibrio sp.]
MNPLISIIVPVYNSEKYIKKCIESILSQTVTDFELIILNDGSTDHSLDVISSFEDNRIVLINKKNTGVANTRNEGIFVAKGDFITFVDSDDWVSDDYLEHLLMLQGINDSDMCMTSKVYMSKSDIKSQKTNNFKIDLLSPIDATAFLLSPKHIVGCWNKLYKKEFLKKNKIIQNESLYSGEGLNFSIKCAQYSNSVTVSNKKIYFYRKNVENSATSKLDLNMVLNNLLSLEIIKSELVFSNEHVLSMFRLFFVNLLFTGFFIIDYSCYKEEYRALYKKWKKDLYSNGGCLLLSKYVSVRFKLKIILGMLTPHIVTTLTYIKRKIQYKNSV